MADNTNALVIEGLVWAEEAANACADKEMFWKALSLAAAERADAEKRKQREFTVDEFSDAINALREKTGLGFRAEVWSWEPRREVVVHMVQDNAVPGLAFDLVPVSLKLTVRLSANRERVWAEGTLTVEQQEVAVNGDYSKTQKEWYF